MELPKTNCRFSPQENIKDVESGHGSLKLNWPRVRSEGSEEDEGVGGRHWKTTNLIKCTEPPDY